MTVFSNSIKFLTDDMMKQVSKQLNGAVTKCDVTWVLTVPAIWTDSAKQFMREAAIEVRYNLYLHSNERTHAHTFRLTYNIVHTPGGYVV